MQQIVPATNVVVNTTNQTITAVSPAVTTLANYYITVTTPGGGTSLVLPSALFVYSPKAPVVTSVTPTSGYTTHGTVDHHQRQRVHQWRHGHHDPRDWRFTREPAEPTAGHRGPSRLEQQDHRHHLPVCRQPYVGASFFITVTTPSGGASPYTTNAVFTFTQAPP